VYDGRTTYEDLRNVNRDGWLLTLIDVYGEILRGKSIKLQLPNFAISDELSSTLGRWDEQRRCITLASVLFEDYSWADVVEVLKHETAHQIVSELFGIKNAVAHGEAFKRACKMLDIPAEATWKPAGRSDGERVVARRIEKLLALGQSNDEHEAEAAVAKAQKLALKYNVEQLQSGVDRDYSLRVIGPAKSRMPSFFWGIMRILCDFHFVTYICRTHNVLEDFEWKRRSVIELYGTAQNLDMAEYVFYFLWHQGELHWKQYKTEHKLRSNKHKLSYLNGLYVGVWERLDAQRQDVAESEALVWRDDPKLDAFFRERNPSVRTSRRSSRLYEDAHSAGNAAGSKLQIHPGLKSSRRGGERKLLE
jgi:hypothetical protein